MITWSAPASNGGSAVLDYQIDWDNGSGTWTTAVTGITGLTYTKTGVTAGTTYQFKIAARNAVGLSTLSSALSVLAASVPATPAAPTTVVDGGSTNVVISWSLPSNGGSAITSYKIYI